MTEEQKQYIDNHPEIKTAQLAKDMGLSIQTITFYRWYQKKQNKVDNYLFNEHQYSCWVIGYKNY